MFIKDLIIFILSLGLLVVIHELGHFITAKIFKVYCREFSIGMGPVLFKLKKPNWETQYSLRALPIGGFVSMVGEEAGDTEGAGGHIDPSKKNEEDLTDEDRKILALPKERRLDGIKKWKRLIIMAAGVVMNVVLAFFLFIGQGVTSKEIDEKINSVHVKEDSVFYNAGYRLDYEFVSGSVTYYITDKNGELIQKEPIVDDKIESAMEFYYIISSINGETYAPKSLNDKAEFKFVCLDPVSKENKDIAFTVTVKEGKLIDGTNGLYYDVVDNFGITYYGRNRTFFEVIKFGGTSIVDGGLLIYKGLFSLFTDGLKNVGGPIAMFQMSSYATSLGISAYFYLWGVISVNLAIMNFLPIPGLDGWHFLVLVVEGITKKEFPSKAKNIASMIGLGLLFGLMILITLKDVIALIF